MNFIVVVVDTLRRDHLPCYGSGEVFAPRLTAFANEAVVFDNCRAASFPTVPARADLMTGRYTFVSRDWGPLPREEPTLAQLLSTAGYLTVGVADTPFLLRSGYGYDQGFQDFKWIRGQRQGPERDDVRSSWRGEDDRFAPRTFAFATRWLERHHKEKFFLYIDTWDPHEPWDPPEYYVQRYRPEYSGEQVSPCYWDWKEDGYSDRDIQIAHACYMGEISMVDRWFGVLLDEIASLGLSDTAVFLVSDHGYYFGEHGQFGKSRFRWEGGVPFEEGWISGVKMGRIYRSPLHNEVTRVPLLARIPAVTPRRIDALVSIPDLMPTILDLAGIACPEKVQASSLAGLLQGRAERVHDFVVTSGALHRSGSVSRMVDDQIREVVEVSPSTVTDGAWDLLYSVTGERAELYSTVEDPGHIHDVLSGDELSDYHRGVARALHGKFCHWLKEMGAPHDVLDDRKEIILPSGAPAWGTQL